MSAISIPQLWTPNVSPWWRLPAWFTAGKAQRDPTTGKIKRNSNGKVVVSSADNDACCCEEAFTCCDCNGQCCFSTNSTATISYNLTSVTNSSGSDFDSEWLSKTDTVSYWRCYEAIIHPQTMWRAGTPESLGDAAYNRLIAWKVCSAATPFGSRWQAGSQGISGTSWPDHYEVQIFDISPAGDCCGVPADSSAGIWIDHYTAGSGESGDDLVAWRKGTGVATITVNNNQCCRDGTCITGTIACADGTCEEDI